MTEGEISALGAAFDEIEIHGIGERRTEGFGRVTFCDPFHWRGEHERVEDESADNGKRCILH
jgi:hypothetical protein